MTYRLPRLQLRCYSTALKGSEGATGPLIRTATKLAVDSEVREPMPDSGVQTLTVLEEVMTSAGLMTTWLVPLEHPEAGSN